MIAVKLTVGFIVHDCDDLDAHTDLVMDELLKLESDTVMDADVSATLSSGQVEVAIVAAGEDFDAAYALANSTIRAAIHAAEGSTPTWRPVASMSRELEAA